VRLLRVAFGLALLWLLARWLLGRRVDISRRRA